MSKRLLAALAVTMALLIAFAVDPALVPSVLIALFILVLQEFLHADD